MPIAEPFLDLFFFFLRSRVSWLTEAILMCGARQKGAMLPTKILTAMARPWNHILNHPLSFVGICWAPSCQITTANILWANTVHSFHQAVNNSYSKFYPGQNTLTSGGIKLESFKEQNGYSCFQCEPLNLAS